MDEDVLERRLHALDAKAVLALETAEALLDQRGILPAHMQLRAEERRHLHPRQTLDARKLGADPRPRDAPGGYAGGAYHLLHRAVDEQAALRDVADLMAALGLVHVVRAHEDGDAARGEAVDHVPELAPRLGIDIGGDVVPHQDERLWNGFR